MRHARRHSSSSSSRASPRPANVPDAPAPQRPQRDRVLAAAVEADHILSLREVPLEREARVLAAQGERERIFGVVVVAVGPRAVGVAELLLNVQ